jgi:hypothetical protein
MWAARSSLPPSERSRTPWIFNTWIHSGIEPISLLSRSNRRSSFVGRLDKVSQLPVLSQTMALDVSHYRIEVPQKRDQLSRVRQANLEPGSKI